MRPGSRFEGRSLVAHRGLPVPEWPVPKQSGRNNFAISNVEQLWQHRAMRPPSARRSAAARRREPSGKGAKPTGASPHGNGRVAPLRKRVAPITLLVRIASDLDRLRRTKELADAEFLTAAGLETVSDLRDI